MLTIYRNETWSCWGLSLGRVLRIHWHVGLHHGTKPNDPRVRLREVSLFGWQLPFGYYVD